MEIGEKEFEQAYMQYSEPIFRFCYFRLYDRERAKDIMQEAFMKTWEYIQKGKPIDNLRAFLYMVARNLSINEVSRKKHHLSLEALNEETGFDVADTQAPHPSTSAEINLAISRVKQLDPENTELLLMRYVDDLAIKDIAKIVREDENTVSVRIHRALKKIKESYGQ